MFCKPPDPLPPRGTIVVLIRIPTASACCRHFCTPWKPRRAHGNIEQTHQLSCLCLATPRHKAFHINLSVLDCYCTPAFKFAVAAFLRPRSFPARRRIPRGPERRPRLLHPKRHESTVSRSFICQPQRRSALSQAYTSGLPYKLEATLAVVVLPALDCS